MPRASERKAVTERFSDLLQRAELSNSFQIDRLKVEISERIYNAMNQQGVSNAELGSAAWQEPRVCNETASGHDKLYAGIPGQNRSRSLVRS